MKKPDFHWSIMFFSCSIFIFTLAPAQALINDFIPFTLVYLNIDCTKSHGKLITPHTPSSVTWLVLKTVAAKSLNVCLASIFLLFFHLLRVYFVSREGEEKESCLIIDTSNFKSLFSPIKLKKKKKNQAMIGSFPLNCNFMWSSYQKILYNYSPIWLSKFTKNTRSVE